MRFIPPFVIASVAIALAPAGCTPTDSCTAVGCGSAAHFQSPIQLLGASDSVDVTVCRNGACSHGTASTAGCVVSGSISAICAVVPSGSTTVLAFDVQWEPTVTYANGDQYVFRAQRGKTNETLVDVTKPAVYTSTQPNGPDCAPTCMGAQL